MEIAKYESEEEYQKAMALINKENEILKLFKSFEAILLSDTNMVGEEDFLYVKEISNSRSTVSEQLLNKKLAINANVYFQIYR
jgi:hypothetical protein